MQQQLHDERLENDGSSLKEKIALLNDEKRELGIRLAETNVDLRGARATIGEQANVIAELNAEVTFVRANFICQKNSDVLSS